MALDNHIIHSDPDILGGTPVFYGTRVPVKNLFDYIETGETIEGFIEDFAGITKEQAVKVLEMSRQWLTYPSSTGYADFIR